MTADAMQTSYTKDTYFEGMQVIADASARGFIVVGYNTVVNAETGDITWYVLMVRTQKKTSVDFNINGWFPFPQQPNNYIEAIGKPLP